MENLESKLLEYLQGAEALILSKAPAAYQAAVQLVHLNAWLGLITGASSLAMAVALFAFVFHHRKKFLNAGDEDALMIVGIFSTILVLLLFMFSFSELFSHANWIGVINPELGLLRDIYMKALS